MSVVHFGELLLTLGFPLKQVPERNHIEETFTRILYVGIPSHSSTSSPRTLLQPEATLDCTVPSC